MSDKTKHAHMSGNICCGFSAEALRKLDAMTSAEREPYTKAARRIFELAVAGCKPNSEIASQLLPMLSGSDGK